MKKQQHQKDQASKSDKKQLNSVAVGVKNLKNNTVKQPSLDMSSKVKLMVKAKDSEIQYKKESKEDEGFQTKKDMKLMSQTEPSQ